MEGYGDNIDSQLCGGLYKEDDDSLFTWSGTDPYAKTNCFTWSKEKKYWIVLGDQYSEEFKNWRRPIHNGQFRSHTLKEKRNTEETCSKYAGSAKFNGINREVKPAIPINSYKDKCCEHMIRNGMWYIFSLPDPRNKYNK